MEEASTLLGKHKKCCCRADHGGEFSSHENYQKWHMTMLEIGKWTLFRLFASPRVQCGILVFIRYFGTLLFSFFSAWKKAQFLTTHMGSFLGVSAPYGHRDIVYCLQCSLHAHLFSGFIGSSLPRHYAERPPASSKWFNATIKWMNILIIIICMVLKSAGTDPRYYVNQRLDNKTR